MCKYKNYYELPLVYIIIVNWNGLSDTIECIKSCRKLLYKNYKIVLVDNGSVDSSEMILNQMFSDIKILQTGENLGFAGGNNIGIRYSLQHSADYVWLLNNDTVVEDSSLDHLVKGAEACPDVGIVGSKILILSNPNVLNCAGSKVSIVDGTSEHIGSNQEDNGQYDKIVKAEFLTGCSILVSRRMIETVGLIPEEYFLYFEETEWCFKARSRGFCLVFMPFSRVYHKVSASVMKTPSIKTYYFTRNRLFFLQRCGDKVNWIFRFFYDIKIFLVFIVKFDFINSYMVILAYWHWINNFMGNKNKLKKISAAT